MKLEQIFKDVIPQDAVLIYHPESENLSVITTEHLTKEDRDLLSLNMFKIIGDRMMLYIRNITIYST